MTREVALDSIAEKVNACLPPDIQVFAAGPQKMDQKEIAWADYEMVLAGEEGFEQKLEEYLNRSQINVIKKTKKGERELDLKPLIYDFTISEVCNSCGDSGIIFSLLVSTGSTDNIKPELVLDHFFRSMGKTDLGRYDFFIHREDMLTGQAPDFVSLGEIGHDKE